MRIIALTLFKGSKNEIDLFWSDLTAFGGLCLAIIVIGWPLFA